MYYRYFFYPSHRLSTLIHILVSQVKTEYFVWCDDDFVFHDKTDLRYLLDKIER